MAKTDLMANGHDAEQQTRYLHEQKKKKRKEDKPLLKWRLMIRNAVFFLENKHTKVINVDSKISN